MALYLGSSGKQAVWCDGEKYTTNFYNSSKFYAYWNTYFSSTATMTSIWGGTNCYVLYSTAIYSHNRPFYATGKKTYSVNANPTLCETDEGMKTSNSVIAENVSFTSLKETLGISSFKECKSITFCYRFRQNTYDVDVLLRPYVLFADVRTNTALTNFRNNENYMFNTSLNGINNYLVTSTNGFKVSYPSSIKGKTLIGKHALEDYEIERLDNITEGNPYYLCLMYDKTTSVSGTTCFTKGITAYFGGYFVFEL